MTKMEFQSEIDNVTLELRSLMDSVKDTSKDVNADEVRAKKAELEEKRSSLIKRMAELDRPVEKATDVRSGFGKLAEGMQKRTATTINGTGGVNAVKELVKTIVKKTNILDGARFFYGPDAATNIPVWGTGLTAAFQAEGGSGTAPASNPLSVTSLTAREALATLPVSKMALDLSSADLEAEIPGIMADAFADLMADGMCNGKTLSDNTTVCMTGLFGASNGTTAYTQAVKLGKLAELARTIRAKKYANPVILMSPSVYGQFVADTTSGEDIKIYKESLIRDKMIEDVPVVLTAYAPSYPASVTGGEVIAVAGDLSNYAIGVAGQVDIVPKQTAGTSLVTFDASSYFAGKPIIAADFYQYKIDNA